MNLLPISHHQQQRQADCLAACAAMVLEYWQRPLPYPQLLKPLRIGPAGAPYHNLKYLASSNLSVQIQSGQLTDLKNCLDAQTPPIVFVNTGELSYWIETTGHALLVSGLDETHIALHDPAFVDAPKLISVAEFDLAWLEMDQFYAILKPTTRSGDYERIPYPLPYL